MDDESLKELLESARVIAVVGCSTNPEKDAHKVPKYMKEAGYRVIPVNPFAEEILGEKAYKSLLEIPGDVKVDIVNVFRPSKDVPPIAEDAVKIGARALWLQLGIRNDEAAGKAEAAGLQVVQDRCIKVEHGRLL
ncbi:MAG: CoA-binding protein [Euryarchaeota archaeon]|nr:CoA-binding protein [Euryarchaeota archaeon]